MEGHPQTISASSGSGAQFPGPIPFPEQRATCTWGIKVAASSNTERRWLAVGTFIHTVGLS